MKFSDGLWLTRPNYEVFYAADSYETEIKDEKLFVLAAHNYISNRGATITGPNLEITYSSPMENVIKVSIKHFKGCMESQKFEINENKGCSSLLDKGDSLELISGKTRAVIKKRTWDIKFFYDDKPLTGCGYRSTSYIKEAPSHAAVRLNEESNNGFWDLPKDKRNTYLREQLNLSVGECIYGLGEKFTSYVKNGQTVEIWNSDGGTGTEQSYKCIPFYVSSRGYGVFVNNTGRISFEVASEFVSRVSFSAAGEDLEYYIIGGEDIGEVLSNYTALTGRPALPPAKTFGLWLSTSFTTDYNEQTINSFIDGMKQRNIPLEIFHFDCFWMREYRWCDFEWDKRQFNNPEEMLKKLKDKGLGICVWINPYIGQRSSLFAEGLNKNYFIKNTDGSVFQSDLWQPGMAIVDFTNPEACVWYKEKLRLLCDMGVDYFKTDFGERIPTDVIYSDKSDPLYMHNYYSYLYNKVVFELLKEYYGENKACVFARSATAGGQCFPVHWGGDCSANYNSMAETIRGGLSLSLSGFGFYSHDISGFESTATPDIYKRWVAFGLLSSHSRLHGSSSYRVPWLFEEKGSDESSKVLEYFTRLKGRLMPYIYSQAIKTTETGIPMMRSMIIDYSNDPACLYLDKQYMFGESLLVAPILNDKGMSEFYLPEGLWTDIISGKSFEGGRFIRQHYDYFSLPLLAKSNSIIAFGRFESFFEYDYLNKTELIIYGLSKIASLKIYSTEAKLLLEVFAEKQEAGILINYKYYGTEKKEIKITEALTSKSIDINLEESGSITL